MVITSDVKTITIFRQQIIRIGKQRVYVKKRRPCCLLSKLSNRGGYKIIRAIFLTLSEYNNNSLEIDTLALNFKIRIRILILNEFKNLFYTLIKNLLN